MGLREAWGYVTWVTLHRWATEASVTQARAVLDWLCEEYPCEGCALNLRRIWSAWDASNANAVDLLCALHSRVNALLKKPLDV